MLTMVQFIDFNVTTYNDLSAERVRFALATLKSQALIKKWAEHLDDSTTHFTVHGSWTAYSTIAALIPKKKTKENSHILISIEHFEDDNN